MEAALPEAGPARVQEEEDSMGALLHRVLCCLPESDRNTWTGSWAECWGLDLLMQAGSAWI